MQESGTILTHILNSTTANFPLVVLALLVLTALIQNFLLFRKLRVFLRGGDGKTLEGTITKLLQRTEELEAHAEKSRRAFDNIDARLAGSIRGVSVKRFDPFQNAGGQQSFTTALLNEKGDGVVIAGIHARDGVRVYAKNISAFISEHELSEEEKSAIEEARTRLKK